MSINNSTTSEPIPTGKTLKMQLPETLRLQLTGYRRFVRITKIAEAVLASILLVILGFLSIYISDRLGETARLVRWTLLLGCLLGCLIIPVGVYRWFWQNRRWGEVARLIRRRQFSLGDHLLSAIELSENPSEQARSPRLCAAALQQVADRAAGLDLREAAPRHSLRWLAGSVLCLSGILLCLSLLYPTAVGNAWIRLALPWKAIPRFTFTAVNPLPDSMVVPHGEEYPLEVQLLPDSLRRPTSAAMQMKPRPKIYSPLKESSYQFVLPGIQTPTPLQIRIGDFSQSIEIVPKLRPELVKLSAEVRLPEYLQRQETINLDIRSGLLAAVEGSRAKLSAETSSPLREAFIGGRSAQVNGTAFFSEEIELGNYSQSLTFQWRDLDGLGSRQPYTLEIAPFIDEPPTILIQDLPLQAVVLDSEQLNFRALAADDFGIRRLGIAWQGLDETLVARPASGRKTIAAGGPDQTNLQVPATFSAAALGIEAQPIELTLWAEDYFPDRPPVYSTPIQLYVLTADEHAIWLTGQINKWHRSALDIRDTEMQLYQANARLRAASNEELQSTQMQEALMRQAALEEANSRKLSALTDSGIDLLRQSTKNPDIAAENIERLAGMIDVLSDIARNRMPSVSDLLKSASRSIPANSSEIRSPSDESAAEDSLQAGQVRAELAADGSSPRASQSESQEESASLPSLVDIESSMQPVAPSETQSPPPDGEQPISAGKLSLPSTALLSPGQSTSDGSDDDGQEAADKQAAQQDTAQDTSSKPLDDALAEQEELLTEFEKIADDLNAVLANLEGSTLVKRLKAASREQSMVAEKIASRIQQLFGRGRQLDEQDRQILSSLAATEHQSSQTLSFIMDDMQAYFDRRRIGEIALVLEEMKSSEVLVALNKLGDDLSTEHGLSIAQAEYWADTIDRWAEDLVESGESSSESSDSPRDSLPPAAILEMLTVLESQVNLREETRVTQQARPAMEESEIEQETTRLAELQSSLKQRMESLSSEVMQLPDGAQNFDQEISLFSAVGQVMGEAQFLLSLGNTGAETLAAQTEAIELMLQSQRINPQGGGGGGTDPGTGATGDAQDSALALLGAGLNQNARAQSRQVEQAVGSSGERLLPEEYRAGLDAYFQRLESRQ